VSVIDLHCHVLPGIDDGPATVEKALELARRAQADGIETIAATPHVDANHPHNRGASIRAAIAELQPQLEAAGIAITLVPGGEVDALTAVELSDEQLRDLHLGGGPYLLLECPLSPLAAPAFLPSARALARRGHEILLAHPERSPLFLREPDRLDELVEEGMLAQVTASSLSGQYGRTVRAFAHEALNRRVLHVAASDGHGANRPATIHHELTEAGIDEDTIAWLTRQMPAAILAGALPPAPPEPVAAPAPAKGRWKRLFGS
jgi:protein-tyrosine phosphatase